MTVRLAVWSGPRNISTAMMRSWENRPDTLVVDEPLYAFYLDRTQLDHPCRDEVIAAGDTSWQRVVDTLVGEWPGGPNLHYQKHMAHHLLPEVDRGWVPQLRNVLLIRDPAEVVASYIRGRGSVVAEDIGLIAQTELYDQLAGAVPVVDSADFLKNPQGYLRFLCDYAGVPFTDAMLSWPPGPRDSDGVWAAHWYHSVWASTGFEPYAPRKVHLEGAALEAADASRPHYERLHDVRVVL